MHPRRAIPILAAAAALLTLWLGFARAETQTLTGVAILGNTDVLGLDTHVPLAVYTAPESAADRTVRWEAMTAAEGLCRIAVSKVGCPYLLGASGPNVFDCSGFVSWCLNQAGVAFVRQNSFDWRTDTHFMRIDDMHDIAVGDVLVFYGDTPESSGHVGFYLGGGRMVDASDSQAQVRVTDDIDPDGGYWSRVFCAAYRVFTDTGVAAVSPDGVLRASEPGRIAVAATANDGGGAADIRFFDVLPFVGMGVEAQPFLLSSPGALQLVSAHPAYAYRLTCDVDLSDACAAGAFSPIGTADAPFLGTFDGGGYCISGLSQTVQGDGPALGGLFGVLTGTVRNLAVRADISVSSQTGGGLAGAIAARVDGGTVTGCAAAGSVTADTAGGLAGYVLGKSAVQDCASLVYVSGKTAGGVAGKLDARAQAVRCSVYGYADGDRAGVVAGDCRGACRDCYALDRMPAADADGVTVLGVEMLPYASSYPAYDFSGVWRVQTPACAFALPSGVDAKHFLPQDTLRFAGGSGVPYAPYRIATAEQLSRMADEPHAWYALTADVTLGAAFVPIGTADAPFTGVLDGGGGTVRGLSVSAAGAGGLFGYTKNAVLTGVSLRDGHVTASTAGLLIGSAVNTTVEGCSVTGSVAGDTAGGVAGRMTGGSVFACYSGADVTAAVCAGGVAGEASADVTQCCASGAVAGATAGGVVGLAAGRVTDCFYTGKAGGVAGQVRGGALLRCYSLYGPVCGGDEKAFADCLGDAAQLTADAFAGFDFTDVWTLDGSAAYAYPELRRAAYLPGLVTDIAVTGPDALPLGFAAAFAATASPKGAAGALVWSVEAGTGAADVTADGVLTGTKAGTVTVVCRSDDGGGAAGRRQVAILDVRVDEVVLTLPETLTVGQTAAFAAQTLPDGVDAAFLTAESSAPHIVSVDLSTGKATAYAAGEAVITVRAGHVTASATVRVHAPPATLRLSQTQLTLPIGLVMPLTYALLPSDAAATVRYASSDPAVATVDRYGFVTALALGQADITCTAADGVSDVCRVTVARGVLSVDGPVQLRPGERLRLRPECQMGVGMRSPRIRYRTSDASVATVSWRGVVRAKGAGECTITVYDKRDPALFATVTVTVSP